VLFCELWAFFCTYRSGRRIKSRGFAVLSVPLLVFSVLLVLNFSNGMIFTFTSENMFERGPCFHVLSAAALFYVVYSFVLLWRRKKNMEHSEYYPHLLIMAAVLAVGLLKLILQLEGAAVWPAAAVGLLVLQLFSLNEKMNIDHLTGLYNRKYLDAYVEDLLSVYKNVQGTEYNACFAALMLDIDSFKSINDTYGHLQGDKALITAAALLKKSVRRGDFVARYGGDEFMIVLDRCGPQTPERVIRRLQDNVRRYNFESKHPYELKFSIGYKLFTNVRGLSAKDVFAKIDELMYKNKQSKAQSNVVSFYQ
jgi:diguanylate cyclase (GGDEF)-like protein